MAALALWNLTIQPGKRFRYTPQNDIRITGAALGPELVDASGRSTLKIYCVDDQSSDEDDEEAVHPGKKSNKSHKKSEKDDEHCLILCSLTGGKIEQHLMDLVIIESHVIDFQVIGQNPIYLSGNYIQNPLHDLDDSDEDEDSDRYPYPDDGYSEEDGLPLDQWSSDVEMPADDLEEALGRFEELPSDAEIPPKTLKRPRESDAVDEEPKSGKLSKAERKKMNKKQKMENGAAIPTGSDPKLASQPATEKPISKSDERPASKANEKAGSKANEKPESKVEKKKDKKKEKEKEKTVSDVFKELSGGLVVKDAKAGTGKTAKNGATLSLRYIGKLADGTVFDSNTKGKPFTFKLGSGDVIKGWDQGIAGMQVGGERIITIPPALGYGNKKISGIPPNSTLTFEVKLVDVK